MNKKLIAVYLGAVVAANLLVVMFGPGVSILNAFALIGLTLTTRDDLHDLWGRHVARNMLALIAVGGAISWAFNSGAGKIALGSVAAFAVSEIVDALIYSRLRGRPFMVSRNASNIGGALADSILFPVIAFGGFPIELIVGQFAAKVVGGYLWARLFAARAERAERLRLRAGAGA